MKFPLERWSGKLALVTGASSGIGAAIAEALAGAGMKVALAGRDRRRLTSVRQRIRRTGGVAETFPCDQRSRAANVDLFRQIRRRLGPVDVFVCCAATRGGHSLLHATPSELSSALKLNIEAAIWGMREAVAHMRRKPEAVIVNIGSLVGHRMLPGVPPLYAATKHALRILTDGLRAELVAENLPIKVAMISPGLVDTPWHRDKKPLPPALQPSDVAEAVCYVLATALSVEIGDVIIRPRGQSY